MRIGGTAILTNSVQVLDLHAIEIVESDSGYWLGPEMSMATHYKNDAPFIFTVALIHPLVGKPTAEALAGIGAELVDDSGGLHGIKVAPRACLARA